MGLGLFRASGILQNPLAVDAYEELQVLCAAHEHGLRLDLRSTLHFGGLLAVWVVEDRGSRLVLYGGVQRSACVRWLADRVFLPRAEWRGV